MPYALPDTRSPVDLFLPALSGRGFELFGVPMPFSSSVDQAFLAAFE